MEQVIRQYSGMVYCIVRGRLGGVCREEDIEECVSDVFVDFHRQIEKQDTEGASVMGLLAMLAKRRAIDRFRRAVTHSGHCAELDEEAVCSIPDSSTLPDDRCIEESQRSRLLSEVDRLGEPDREIILRRFFLEQNVTDIAAVLGMNRPAVSKRISRALARLRGRMEDMRG
ncbi:MAG: sigma-70 family RNA polymerase sigma factor [Ruminococcaceae bacterium]|nr:sigma-70 family RNA polymerase sigma factor [Oscillospiraceae bacterium]